MAASVVVVVASFFITTGNGSAPPRFAGRKQTFGRDPGGGGAGALGGFKEIIFLRRLHRRRPGSPSPSSSGTGGAGVDGVLGAALAPNPWATP